MKKKQVEEKMMNNITKSISKVAKDNLSEEQRAKLIGKAAGKAVVMTIKEMAKEKEEKKQKKKEK